jgi:hypothetical protein
MAEREPQFVTVSRQGIMVATLMGVVMLALFFVIGVLVGKSSLGQGGGRAKTLDEELNELPEPLDEQLKLFGSIEGGGAPRVERTERPRQEQAPAPVNKQEQAPPAAPQKQAAAVPEAPGAPNAAKAPADRYTAQVMATASPDTAKRVSERLKAAGMRTKVVRADGLYKVQLDWRLPRADLDQRMPGLRALGYEPVPVKLK